MGKIRLGINGFGRIGKLVCRAALERPDIFTVVAINDPFADVDFIAYSLTHDSIHGRLNVAVRKTISPGILKIGENSVRIYACKEPALVPWGDEHVDYVIDATGVFYTKEKAQGHIDAGARRVIFTGPPKDDTPMFVCGVNLDQLSIDMPFVSNASCTTNCLAPLAKVVNDAFGIESGLMTTVHSTTATQKTVDGPSKKDWRGGRAASGNIIPSSTGAASAVGKVLPELAGRLTGISVRVPTLDVSMVDLTVNLKRAATYEEVCSVIKSASKTSMRGIIGYTDEQVVSSDFIGDSRTCVFDATAGMALGDRFMKLVAWYDNEWAYSCKVLDLADHMACADGTLLAI